jgi:hypothetical protein
MFLAFFGLHPKRKSYICKNSHFHDLPFSNGKKQETDIPKYQKQGCFPGIPQDLLIRGLTSNS